MKNNHIKLRLGFGLVKKISYLVVLTIMLAACGFQIRGMADLAFKKLYMQSNAPSITRDLTMALETNGVELVKTAETADLLLEVMNETSERRILSLSGTGVVREFELHYQINFRTRAPANTTWSPVQSVQSRRDLSYNDGSLLGKADEELMLYNDMRKDAVRELIRRLTAVRPSTQVAE
jgi:LPS-assembly lipoprotein